MPSSPCPLAASAQPRRGVGLRELVRKPLVGRDGHGGLGACLGQGRLPAQVMQHGSPVQGEGETQGVGELLGQGQRRLDAGHRLVGVPEEPEGLRSEHGGNTPRGRARCRVRHGCGAAADHRAASPVPGGAGRRRARRQRASWSTGRGGPRAGGPGLAGAGPG